MAYYHKNLEYHEDTTEKHEITEVEREFLRELQKELNTQDDCGQADPRFWVIKGTEKIWGVEYGDIALISEDIEIDDMEEIIKFIQEEILPEINENLEEPFVLEDNGFDDPLIIQGDKYITHDLDGLAEWLSEKTGEDYCFRTYEEKSKVYENTMFLTQKDAEEHLRANHYHYSKDAHTYAMTAWRDPRMEKLVDILQSVKW
ncbi:MAG: hypothetical protein KH020_20975 [Clostridiales bacterium]|nr:hypothetical protein [Clostridiales bacterium]